LVMLRVKVMAGPQLLRSAVRAAIIDLVCEAGSGTDQGEPDVVIVNADDQRVAPIVIRLPAETGEPGRVLVRGKAQGAPLHGIDDIRSALITLSTDLEEDEVKDVAARRCLTES
jgi:hypothetical protein